jgi:taurine dioxygenase
VREFVGHSLEASRRLYDLFQSFVVRPENTVRWRWALGDLAIWDNRATQHYALSDYGDETRIMRRITLQGDIPKSVDGRDSRQLAGGPDPLPS